MNQIKMTDEVIRAIELVLDIKLYDNQKAYLQHDEFMPAERCTGRTTAYCIKLALSKGHPLNLNRPEEFSDRYPDKHGYARSFFLRQFLETRQRLLECGFPVREVRK
jgi:hypothetical protein